MDQQRKVFKLIIMPTKNATELLQWMVRNIPDISACGVIVRIQKIEKDEFDAEMVDTMRNKGITSLPALISPAGKIYIGNTAIKSMFSGGLNRARATTRAGELMDTTDIDMDDYLSREITGGMRRTPKGLVADDDEDDDEDDLEKKMRDYNRKAPRQHRPNNTAEYEADASARAPPRRSGGRRPPTPPPDDTYDDDYGYDDRAPARGRGRNDDYEDNYGGGGGGVDDEYDRRILDTLLSNVPTPGF